MKYHASLWKPLSLVIGGLCVLVTPWSARGQFVDQRYQLTREEGRELFSELVRLRRALDELQERSEMTGRPSRRRLADVEVYQDGVRRCLRQRLLFRQQDVGRAQECLAEGIARAEQLQQNQAPWRRARGIVHFGFKSDVDDSVQPAMVFVPEDYDFDGADAWPLEVFLHGRAGQLSEINFLRSRGFDGRDAEREQKKLVLYPYGRSNNGYHFAGERDVFEALAEVKRRYRIDENRIVLRGFSMGGHGAWQIGLHHPDQWSAISPGAGFVESRRYLRITQPIPSWEEKLMRQYDALEYAANASSVPLYSYVGSEDPATAQHGLMKGALEGEMAPFTELIGPETGHRYHPETRKTLLINLEKHVRDPQPRQVRFVTYTLRYDRCFWLRLTGLNQHWERTEIRGNVENGNAIAITTRNISSFALTPPDRRLQAGQPLNLTIDNRPLKIDRWAAGEELQLIFGDGGWNTGRPIGLRKAHGIQGPIDDALLGSLAVVTGTGTPWDDDLDAWTRQEVRRFRLEWQEYFRGELPIITDRDLTREDIRGKNLYLFGDPGSNSVLRRAVKATPLDWTPGAFRLAGRSFATNEYVPMMIYPNPINPRRYIVINTGFTFSSADMRGSNARQRPMLPDYAVIKYQPGQFADERRIDTVMAGFFNEQWQLPPAQ